MPLCGKTVDLKPNLNSVPLCGKTVDLKFLYEQGLTVVGIELSDIAIQSFSTENNMPLTAEVKDGYTIHTFDERLKIFQGDLFDFTPEKLSGLFDYWWDCGSLISMVNEEDQKYINLILSLLKIHARGLIALFQYDESLYKGRPKSMYKDRLVEILDSKFKVKDLSCLSENDLPKDYTVRTGVSEVYHTVYFVQRIKQ